MPGLGGTNGWALAAAPVRYYPSSSSSSPPRPVPRAKKQTRTRTPRRPPSFTMGWYGRGGGAPCLWLLAGYLAFGYLATRPPLRWPCGSVDVTIWPHGGAGPQQITRFFTSNDEPEPEPPRLAPRGTIGTKRLAFLSPWGAGKLGQGARPGVAIRPQGGSGFGFVLTREKPCTLLRARTPMWPYGHIHAAIWPPRWRPGGQVAEGKMACE